MTTRVFSAVRIVNRRTGFLPALLTVLVTAGCLGPDRSNLVEVGQPKVLRADLQGAEEVQLDLPVGAAVITGVEGDTVRLVMTAQCTATATRCANRISRIELAGRRHGNRLLVGPDRQSRFGYAGALVHFEAEVPRDIPLSVNMGYGELLIAAMETDVNVKMSVGDVGVRLPERAVGTVRLRAGNGGSSLGRASGAMRPGEDLLVGSELTWEQGRGKHSLAVDLRIGDIEVRLE